MNFETKELRPGEKLGRYQLLLPIARGGMGQVWAARRVGTRGTQGLVAVKTLLPTHEDSEQLQGMLRSEARLASQIRHPNVAETFELGEQDGTFYLVMEWVEGLGLNYLVETVGPERVMLGSDYPYDMNDVDPVRAIASLPHLSDDQRELIYGGNAMRLFRIG